MSTRRVDTGRPVHNRMRRGRQPAAGEGGARRGQPCYAAGTMRPGVAQVLALAAVGGWLVAAGLLVGAQAGLLAGLQGCGGRATTAPPEKKDGGPGAPGPSDAAVEVDAVALGLPDL